MYSSNLKWILVSVQFSSVTQSCAALCDPMDCSTPGLPVHHQLLEFTQTLVHWVSDAIQPSHPLSFPSPTFNLSQHQGFFQWVSSSHQVAKVLEFQLQHQSFQWIFRTDFLYQGLVGSPCHPRDSQESSPTPQFCYKIASHYFRDDTRHIFLRIQNISLFSSSQSHYAYWKKETIPESQYQHKLRKVSWENIYGVPSICQLLYIHHAISCLHQLF